MLIEAHVAPPSPERSTRKPVSPCCGRVQRTRMAELDCGTAATSRGARPLTTVSEDACAVAQLFVSAAVIVNANGPSAVGVPSSEPPAVSARPGGSAPDVTLNVTGAAVAVSSWWYGVLRTGSGSTVGVTVVAGQTRS